MKKGENSQTLKRNNRALILGTVLSGGVSTRVGLARVTGLNKMTVGNIVSDLIENGYLIEGVQAHTSSVGRKPIELKLAPDAPKVVGVNIRRDGIGAILVDLALNHISKASFVRFSKESQDSVMEKAVRIAQDLVGRQERVLGVGVSTMGQYDVNTGNVLCPVDFFGLRDMPLKAIMQERIGLPVYVDNDSNCGALAEKMFGCGREYDCFLYISVTRGVGAGIVIGGELLGNSNGLMGEIGHVSVDIHGEECSCGNRGCLELYTSIACFEREIERATGRARAFLEFVEEDDSVVEAVLNQGCDTLADALTGAVNMLDPQLIVIGHEGAMLPERYIERIEQRINRRIIARDYKRVSVCRSSFGADAALYGAASSLIKQLFNGKLLNY